MSVLVVVVGTFLSTTGTLVSLSASWVNWTNNFLLRATSRDHFTDYSYGNLADGRQCFPFPPNRNWWAAQRSVIYVFMWHDYNPACSSWSRRMLSILDGRRWYQADARHQCQGTTRATPRGLWLELSVKILLRVSRSFYNILVVFNWRADEKVTNSVGGKVSST